MEERVLEVGFREIGLHLWTSVGEHNPRMWINVSWPSRVIFLNGYDFNGSLRFYLRRNHFRRKISLIIQRSLQCKHLTSSANIRAPNSPSAAFDRREIDGRVRVREYPAVLSTVPVVWCRVISPDVHERGIGCRPQIITMVMCCAQALYHLPRTPVAGWFGQSNTKDQRACSCA